MSPSNPAAAHRARPPPPHPMSPSPPPSAPARMADRHRRYGNQDRPSAASPRTQMFFDYYMSHVRPRLNRGRGGDSLWLNRSGSSLSEHRVYLIIVELTQRAFGVSVNPHLFRRIFATSVSIVDPQVIEGARAALGHATSLTTQQHYNRATSLTAARNHMEIVRRLRRRTNPLWKERERRSELKILKDGPLTICRKPTCA